MAPVRPEPGFDPGLYASHDSARSALWIVGVLTFVVSVVLGALWWLDRPTVREPVLRGSLSQRLYVPALLANERVLVARTVGEAR